MPVLKVEPVAYFQIAKLLSHNIFTIIEIDLI
jgi:hypothetical protein